MKLSVFAITVCLILFTSFGGGCSKSTSSPSETANTKSNTTETGNKKSSTTETENNPTIDALVKLLPADSPASKNDENNKMRSFEFKFLPAQYEGKAVIWQGQLPPANRVVEAYNSKDWKSFGVKIKDDGMKHYYALLELSEKPKVTLAIGNSVEVEGKLSPRIVISKEFSDGKLTEENYLLVLKDAKITLLPANK